ncbi:Cyclin-J [Acipenser ruthenus]|uniref:Cyclin-J n=1 Tax=Acipenser ruthenus TaxID=7906 RepID=A0A444UN33_ACIRT|nr:Cyclin-J [Acipenser ruthenus]
MPSYKGQSPQLNLRRYFADLIAIVSNRFRLCPPARHLAVYLLDLFMDRYDISVQQLHVVALSCLLLASKFEDKEDHVPKLEQLNSLGCMTNMNLVLTKQSLLHMELLLLETFQWNLYLPTAAHFIDYYLSIAVHETDLHEGWPMACLEKTRLYMAKYADYFLEVSLQASSRVILRLSPTWPTRLHRLSAYSWDLLIPCVERLLLAHDNDVKEANKQKCQQPSPQSGQTVYQTHTQLNAPPQIQQHVSQYLHQQQLPYPQQNCQPILTTGHMPSYTIRSHPSNLQASIHPHGHVQAVAGMTLQNSLDVKEAVIRLWIFSSEEINNLVFVSDQATNVQAALGQWSHLSCIAHVQKEQETEEEEEMQPLTSCLEQCKALATNFKHSGLQVNLKCLLKQECETRWNTKFEMVESVLESFEDVQMLILSRGEMHRISNINKDMLQLLVSFLQPFKRASEEMSGSKYLTINLIALWKTTLLTSPSDMRVLEHCWSYTGESPHIFRNIIRQQFIVFEQQY